MEVKDPSLSHNTISRTRDLSESPATAASGTQAFLLINLELNFAYSIKNIA